MPNLPQGQVSVVAVSSEYPQIISALQKKGISVLQIEPCLQLDEPVASHADMQLLHLGKNKILLSPYQKNLILQLEQLGIDVLIGEKLGKEYPTDILYNIAVFDKFYICNDNVISKTAQTHLRKQGLQKIHVSQGYSKCSVCIVDKDSIITADPGIAKAAQKFGISVLEIQPNYIKIPKYNTGFIGGCCGKLSPNLMVFTGKISEHPDYNKIQNFLYNRKIEICELTQEDLLDVGGILPIMEKI